MYRVLQSINNKNADATYKAAVDMKKGMFVVKGTDGKVNFPTSATDKNVFIVGKEFVATGKDILNPDLPDYSDSLEDIKAGEFVTLEKAFTGEVYFTDQATGTIGSYVLAGTAGKLITSGTAATKLAVRDSAYQDCGRVNASGSAVTGIVIEVIE